MKNGKGYDIREMAVDGVLTAILVILGMIKLPSIIPGTEFQLSAPYAVCIAVLVGFKRYLGIGICSSVIQLMLGTHTIWNVAVAMVFRVVAGSILSLTKNNRCGIYLAGPLGTIAARGFMAVLMHVPFWPLVIAAAPGMVFTVIGVVVVLPVMRRILMPVLRER